jgi:hypothetical protein
MRTGYVVVASAICLAAVGGLSAVLATSVGAGNPGPAAGGSGRPPSSQPTSAASTAGAGPGVTRIFAGSADWRLAYRVDCSAGGGSGPVDFEIHAASGAVLVSIRQAVASGTTSGTGQSGWQALTLVNSGPTCDWSVAASPAATPTPSQS